ncbi:MAG TPA: hypothetical protein VHU82_07680 [Vicinamibacterales bacterium]|nr:hypothetical protein [Vicinamibacterales bacterium]
MAAQQSERREHLRVAEVRIAPARIGQDEYVGAFELLALRPEHDGLRRGTAEHRPVKRDAYKRHNERTPAADLPPQAALAGRVFGGAQRIDAGCGTRDEIRDADAELGQPVILRMANRLRHETRFVQQLPESVRRPREVVPDLGGPHPRIDADEQQTYGHADAIGQPLRASIRPFAPRPRFTSHSA